MDTLGQATPPSGGSFTAISAGIFHTCALSATGAMRCWGSDDFGQISVP